MLKKIRLRKIYNNHDTSRLLNFEPLIHISKTTLFWILHTSGQLVLIITFYISAMSTPFKLTTNYQRYFKLIRKYIGISLKNNCKTRGKKLISFVRTPLAKQCTSERIFAGAQRVLCAIEGASVCVSADDDTATMGRAASHQRIRFYE